MKRSISQRDLELISAYLDRQLNARQRARLEARIKSNPELHTTLVDLRKTRLLMHSLPRQKAPRNFALSPAVAGAHPRLPVLLPSLRLASALAALMLVVVLAGDFLGVLAPAPTLPFNEPAIAEEVALEMAPETYTEQEAGDAAPLAMEAPEALPTETSVMDENSQPATGPDEVALKEPPLGTYYTETMTNTARIAPEFTAIPSEEAYDATGGGEVIIQATAPAPTATLPAIPTFTEAVPMLPTETPPPPPTSVPIPTRTPENTPPLEQPVAPPTPSTGTGTGVNTTLRLLEAALAIFAILTGLAAILLRRGGSGR
ncbi:MAG: zf-HC2 domain-containing protein [Anaerolineales bacterium]|nr:zf-HC2 domain-containing protein [Anaerolineales bacterium]